MSDVPHSLKQDFLGELAVQILHFHPYHPETSLIGIAGEGEDRLGLESRMVLVDGYHLESLFSGSHQGIIVVGRSSEQDVVQSSHRRRRIIGLVKAPSLPQEILKLVSLLLEFLVLGSQGLDGFIILGDLLVEFFQFCFQFSSLGGFLGRIEFLDSR